MPDEMYKIVFQGKIQEQFDIETVKGEFARAFKLRPEKVEEMFSGQKTVLKKNLGREQALKYKHAILQTGADCQILKINLEMEKGGEQRTGSVKESTKAAVFPERESIPENITEKEQAPVEPPAGIVIRDAETSAQALAGFHVDLEALEERLRQESLTEESVKDVIEDCKGDLIPEMKSAYTPSGKTTNLAIGLMVPAIPLSAVLSFACCYLCLILFEKAIFPFFLMIASYLGKWLVVLTTFGLAILLLCAIVFISAIVCAKTVHFFGRMGGNRNVPLVAVSATISALLVVVPSFIYAYRTIPIFNHPGWFSKICLIGLFIYGAVIVLCAGIEGEQSVAEDKFCEEKNAFLRKYTSPSFELSGIPTFIEALKERKYAKLKALPVNEALDNQTFHINLFMLHHNYLFSVGYVEAEISTVLRYQTGNRRDGELTKRNIWRFLSLAYDSKELIKLARGLNIEGSLRS